jgi:uracil-DNA glycosylase
VDAQRYQPDRRNVTALRRAAASCHGCDLYKDATQTVFSEGPVKARLVMIGEQPGDREDLAGKPFVGPAGRMLDKLLDDVGIERGDVYLTNVVKHFASPNAENAGCTGRRITRKSLPAGPGGSPKSRRYNLNCSSVSAPSRPKPYWARVSG